jgi:aminodeoxyfutalosine synthase
VAALDELTAKVDAGERLSDEDIAALGSSRDIITLGMLASAVRRRLHGTEVTYVRVADLKQKGDLKDRADLKVGTTSAGVPEVGVPDVVPTFRSALSSKSADVAGEVRIFETPGTLDAAIEAVENAREVAGTIPLSAFCLYELGKLPEGLPVVLAALKKAGLDLITQAPIDRLAAPESTLQALVDAGLELARLTVNATPGREWTALCRDVAVLQTRLRAIRAFAPLARTIDMTQPTTGYEDVKRIALARLLADNIDTIQVDWALYGPKLAQVALTFGADDIDSVAAEDDQSQGRRRSPVEEIRRSIQAAGFEPVERDGNFNRR